MKLHDCYRDVVTLNLLIDSKRIDAARAAVSALHMYVESLAALPEATRRVEFQVANMA